MRNERSGKRKLSNSAATEGERRTRLKKKEKYNKSMGKPPKLSKSKRDQRKDRRDEE